MSVLCVSFYASAYDFEVDGIYYNAVSLPDLTCEVTHGDEKYVGDIVIPSTVEYNSRNLTVVNIGNDAFRYCYDLTSVVFPESLTCIGSSAFLNCSGLTSLTFPKNLTEIWSYAFRDCRRLTSVAFPEGLTRIGGEAFSGC